jgi:hypothetical protein
MLSSITPLGQRGRGNSWLRTVIAFWVGAVMAGAALFGAAGATGDLVGVSSVPSIGAVLIIAVAALLDALGIQPYGPRRQVDEDWLGRYRDWVTGFGFGAQLGAGVATIVRTWSVWGLIIVSAIVGLPLALALGLAFGAGRAALLLVAARVRSPADLSRSMARFARSEALAKSLLGVAYALVLTMGVIYGP